MAMTDSDRELLKKLSRSSLQFALALNNLVDEKDDNTFFSPVSIFLALGMTRCGSKADTLDQLTKALHLHLVGKEEDDILKACSLVIDTLNKEIRNEYSLNPEEVIQCVRTANRMYVQESFELLQEFKDALKETFKVEAGLVDFLKNSEKARVDINKWVEVFTNDKIRDIITPGMLNEDTRLVLVNAVYFKATWANKFEESATEPMDFQANPTKIIKVDMMIQKNKFHFAENLELDCKVLDLSYIMSTMSMTILLPNQNDGLDNLISQLNPEIIENVCQSLQKETVNVKLPKFKMETKYELQDVLEKLGITHLFTPAADLSGITGKRDLCVSAVVHKTFLDVNEKGTEAAAATVVMMMMGRSLGFPEPPRPEKHFIADHPFVFFIRDYFAGVVFMGCLRNPPPK